ncbi:MAG: hypothetical protein LAT67_09230 [Balneolales bacterium]|nr:hypothetical protein [Balneolales bacterium]
MPFRFLECLAAVPVFATEKTMDFVETFVTEARGAMHTASDFAMDAVHTVGDFASDAVEEGQDLVEDAIGTHRRVWQGQNGHAQIEVRGIDNPENDAIRENIKEALQNLKEVRWVEVNALTRRVAVAFDSRTPVERLVSVVESVEMLYGIRERNLAPKRDGDMPFDHPSDAEPIHRAMAALAGNGLAFGFSIIGQVTGKVLFMDRLASTVSMIDIIPQSRIFVERLIGRPAKRLLFPLLSAFGNGLGQGTVGIIADSVQQASLLTEAQARKRVWERREPELYDKHEDVINPPIVGPRPCPIPDGPVEEWVKDSAMYTLMLASLTLAYTWRFSAAADVLFCGVAKAAHFGREGFSSQIGRVLAARGVIPMDPTSLRRLDRVNTVVLDSNTLLTGRLIVQDAIPVEGLSIEEADDLARRVLSYYNENSNQHPRSLESRGDENLKLISCNLTPVKIPDQFKHVVLRMEEDGLLPYLLRNNG